MCTILHRAWRLGIFCLATIIASSTLLEGRALAQGSVAAKRKEAARVSARIEDLNARIASLNEDFLTSQERLARLRKQLAASKKSGAARSVRISSLKAALREQGLRLFSNPTGKSTTVFDAESIGEAERRVVLAEQGTQRLADAADLLAAERQDQEREERLLAEARKEEADTSKLLQRKRAEAEALFAELQVLEKKVDAQLQNLIEEERIAAERAEAARQRAAEKKRQERARTELANRRRADRDAALRRRAGNGARVAESPVSRSPAVRRPEVDPGSRTDDAAPAGVDLLPVDRAARSPRVREEKQLEIDAGVVHVQSAPGASRAVGVALSQLGKPYVWGAEGPGSYDCSGLMLYAWRAAGRSLPHSSRMQYASTRRVHVSQIQPGDLVFYGRPIHHVGMYIGNGNMVEASRRGVPVRVRSIFRKDLVGVGRL